MDVTSLPGEAVWVAGLGAWALALSFSAVSFGVGAATGSKSLALGSGSAAAAGTYVLFGLSAFVARSSRCAGSHRGSGSSTPTRSRGADATFWWQAVALPLAVAAAFAAGGVARLARRDIG